MIQRTKVAQLTDELEDYRLERVRLIKASLQPIALRPGAKILLHIVPAKAFEDTNFDLTSVGGADALLTADLGGWGTPGFNFDGFMMTTREKENAESYVQVFHNGIVEAVNASYLQPWNDRNLINATGLEEMLIEAASKYTSFQRKLGVIAPVFVMLSLLDVKGYRLVKNQNYGYSEGREIDRADLLIPAVKQDSFDAEPEDLLRPLFYRLWNAAGFRRSMNYNENGKRNSK
jgi:hypothetical protein